MVISACSPLVNGIGSSLSLACIAGGYVEGTVIIAGPGIRTLSECGSKPAFLSQFTGKAIGTPPRGSIHDVIVRELLQEYGFPNISVKNNSWADFLSDALVSGEIACAAETLALALNARRKGMPTTWLPRIGSGRSSRVTGLWSCGDAG